MRARVVAARDAQRARIPSLAARANADLDGTAIWRLARPDRAGLRLLEQATRRLGLSARGYDRVLKVARTIADLDASGTVRAEHVGEALQYRIVE